MKRKKLRIAVQKSGRLRELSLKFFSDIGISLSEETDTSRALIAQSCCGGAEFLFVRHADIPTYVQSGVADFAIVGGNILEEGQFEVQQIATLPFGECRLAIAVPLDSPIVSASDLDGERIATSYPNSLRKFLRRERVNASLIEISGSVEIAPALDMADAICDLVQSGATLKENNLQTVFTIFDSSAVVIESPYQHVLKNILRAAILNYKAVSEGA
ncbi:MAG: ATP phosphoribosyltransferase [Bacillota bacterium]